MIEGRQIDPYKEGAEAGRQPTHVLMGASIHVQETVPRTNETGMHGSHLAMHPHQTSPSDR